MQEKEKSRVTKAVQQSKPPTGDPYTLLQEQYSFILQKLASLEQQVNSLQTTWDRLLNVANEPIAPRREYRAWQQPQQQPPPEPKFERSIPVWEREKLEEPKEEKPKKKKSTKGIIFFIVLVLVVLFVMLGIFLQGQGWSCALPIPGLK